MKHTLNLSASTERITAQAQAQCRVRAHEIADVLEAAGLRLLTGQRHGRRYRWAGGWYTASAPGELPAERSGVLRRSTRKNVKEQGGGGRMVFSITLDWLAPYASAVSAKRPLFPPAVLEAVWPEVQQLARRPLVGRG